MRLDEVSCINCGAQGVKGAQCPYCGSRFPIDERFEENDTENPLFGSHIGLPDTYVIEASIGQSLYIVKSTENNCNKYGVYNAINKQFELQPVYTSIMPCGNGNYIAKANIPTENNGILSQTIEFSSISGFQEINRAQRYYQQKECGGCASVLLLCIITTIALIMI